VNYGWLLRYMHSTGASAFFAIIYIHMARTLFYGSYRAPRELLWWTGQGLLLLLMATAFMGYLLPWGQMSYWGAAVITNLFRATPFFGEQVVIWLRGDFQVGDATLTRFYALHFLFPFIIVGAVLVHLIALHTVKSSNPSGLELKQKDIIPFHPYFTIKDLVGVGAYLMVFSVFVFFIPNTLIESANNIPANPMQTPAHIVPEWYFLPFYAILRSLPDLAGGVVAMGLSVVIFAAMPYLDRSRISGGAVHRPVYRAMFYLFLVNMFVLGYVGAVPPTDRTIIIGQVATLIYFGIFLFLPFISKKEEAYLIKRGLPPAVMESLNNNANKR
jgi:ubiquinol-cytochrome c reductase cytochrome b subunit